MKLEIIGTAAIIGLILGVVTFISYQNSRIENLEQTTGKLETIIDNQNEEIKVKDEFIKERKQTTIRKSINRAVPTNVNIEWLRENRCQDCKA